MGAHEALIEDRKVKKLCFPYTAKYSVSQHFINNNDKEAAKDWGEKRKRSCHTGNT